MYHNQNLLSIDTFNDNILKAKKKRENQVEHKLMHMTVLIEAIPLNYLEMGFQRYQKEIKWH